MSESEVETATKIVDLIRAQNWKNGDVLIIDYPDAIELVAQALRAAHAAGATMGSKSTGESMILAFDASQQAYLDKLATETARPVDLTQVIGGPQEGRTR